MTALATRCLSFDELDVREWHDIVRLRVDVFVVEQDCAYPEIDGEDLNAQHVLGYAGGQIHVYARIILPTEEDPCYHIGRVIVHARYRKRGLGTDLMNACMRWIQARSPEATVRVQAQAYLQDWYGELGFQAISETYDWDGIPHLDMEFQGERLKEKGERLK